MINVDVAIIGTGPGGGMAANRLAATGLRVAILEKASLPRHKPCGGCIPVSALQLFNWDISEMVEHRPPYLRALFEYGQEKTVEYRRAPMMINRSRFDAYLVRHALETGGGDVTLHEGFAVKNVVERVDNVEITATDGTLVRAAYLIAGDGVFSVTARCLGLVPDERPAVALDAEVMVDPEVYEAEKGYATFNFNCVPNGYAWIFPKGDCLSCGVGVWRAKYPLQAALTDYLERSLPPGSIRSIERSGHPIPLFTGNRTIATQRVCLVGDAANMVDPVMGEGIRFALHSGALAGETVAGLLGLSTGFENPPDIAPLGEGSCRQYQDLVHKEIGSSLGRLSRFIAPIFLKAPDYFYRKFFIEGNSYFRHAAQMEMLTSGPSKLAFSRIDSAASMTH